MNKTDFYRKCREQLNISHFNTREILTSFQREFTGSLRSVEKIDFKWTPQGEVLVEFKVTDRRTKKITISQSFKSTTLNKADIYLKMTKQLKVSMTAARELMKDFQHVFKGHLESIEKLDFSWNENGSVVATYLVHGCPEKEITLASTPVYVKKYVPIEMSLSSNITQIPNVMYDTYDDAVNHFPSRGFHVSKVVEVKINY